MPRQMGRTYEFWSPRLAYLFALLAVLQYYTWPSTEGVGATGQPYLGSCLRLLIIWAFYALPSILVESTLGAHWGPPDGYFAGIPLYRGCTAGMLCSLLIAIPFYATNTAHSLFTGYQVLLSSTASGEMLRNATNNVLDGDFNFIPSWSISGFSDQPGITLQPAIVVLLLWLSIALCCCLGPQSFGWSITILFTLGAIFSITLLGYFAQLPPRQVIMNVLNENLQPDNWLSLRHWKAALLLVNRQALLGFGIFGTFAAYTAMAEANGNRLRGRNLPAVCLVLLFILYPIIWLAMTMTQFSIKSALSGPNRTVMFHEENGNQSNGTNPGMVMAKWIASYKVLQACTMLTTLACLVEIWCNTWARVVRSAFPFTFRRFYVYRPTICATSCIVFACLTFGFVTPEGARLYDRFYRYTTPFLLLEVSHTMLFYLMHMSHVWDRVARHRRVVAKRHSRESQVKAVGSMCYRLLASLGLTLFTLYMLTVAVYRGIIYAEAELVPKDVTGRNDTISQNESLSKNAIIELSVKILMAGSPWFVAVVTSIYLCIRDRKSTSCHRLCCPAVDNRGGFYPGGMMNNNVNEHYWPDEFEVLPYEPY